MDFESRQFYHILFELYIPKTTYTLQASLPSFPTDFWSAELLPDYRLGVDIKTHLIKHKDYRFGNLSIDSIEMNDSTFPKKSHSVVPTSGHFVPFTLNTSELNSGILHLYRDKSEISELVDPKMPRFDNNGTVIGNKCLSSSSSCQEDLDNAMSGNILAVLAVPSYLTSQDFLNFMGPVQSFISHFRIIRDSFPNRYMVLLKFREEADADMVYNEYNGRQFNSLEPEVCHIVYIKSIEFKSRAIPPYAFPPTADSNSFFPYSIDLNDTEQEEETESPLSSNIPVIELPTCPVCLDRMDASVTGLLTIVCHHTFHCHCISKWGDSSCPVCRYSLSKSLLSDQEEASSNECGLCGVKENLWICLICGNIGCGRYAQKHAYDHFTETSHIYSLELETQRVWDYIGDGYVHRLIQNTTDGKLVELSAPNHYEDNHHQLDHRKKSKDDYVSDSKLEHITIEYTYLLTSQMESQRLFYESQIAKVQEQFSLQVEQLSQQIGILHEANEIANTELARLANEKQNITRKHEKLAEKVNLLTRTVQEEESLNKGLLENRAHLKQQLEAKDALNKEMEAQVVELKEQVRDLMFFLEASKTIAGSDEMKDGSCGVVESTSPQRTNAESPSKKKGKSRRK